MASRAKIVEFPRRPNAYQAEGFYTAAQAARLARVPRQRVDAWRREGIIPRTVLVVDSDGKQDTGYSFEGVMYLRLLRMLREYVPLEKAVRVAKHLVERFGPPGPSWADARIFRDSGNVYAMSKDEWGVTEAARGQKAAHELLFTEDFEQLRDRADALLVPTKFQRYIEVDPSVRSGQPVVSGTNIRSIVLYRLKQKGLSAEKIRQEYPALTLQQVKGAIEFERFLDYEAA